MKLGRIKHIEDIFFYLFTKTSNMVPVNCKHVYNKLQLPWSDTWLIGGFNTTCMRVCVFYLWLLYPDLPLWRDLPRGSLNSFHPLWKSRHGLCGCSTSGTIRHVYNSRGNQKDESEMIANPKPRGVPRAPRGK